MNEFQQLKLKVQQLEKMVSDMQKVSTLPIDLQRALESRGFVRSGGSALDVASGGTGRTSLTSGSILKGAGTTQVAFVAPLSGNNTFWAANSSGGATTKGINITDGIVVSFS